MIRWTRNLTIGLTAALALLAYCGPDPDSHKHEEMASGSSAAGSVYDLDLRFTNEQDAPVALNSFAGRPVILSMIYTQCQSICPLQASNMLKIQNSLPEADREKVQFVLFSFDEADGSQELAAFSRKMKFERNWTLLGGNPNDVRELAAALGFQYRKTQDGSFSHSAVIYLLNDRGEVVFQKEGTTGAPDEFAEHVAHLAGR
jgi:protein SCO1/2